MKSLRRISWRKLFLTAGILAAAGYFLVPGCRKERRPAGFIPEPNRMIGIRFDPSFFYNRGVTAHELAAQLVPKWKRAGINTVFFRVYDPTYGASYRTNLPYNTETDYGKQDLLGAVLKEAHRNGISVYAWLTVLNHRGAWEAKPAWRELRPNGKPYRSESLPYPLCPRHPGVKQWWLRFVNDLLDHYPGLDGIDLAEPSLSWREGEACYCRLCRTGFVNGGKEAAGSWEQYRAQPLTELLVETLRRAEDRKLSTMLTTVLPADAQGAVLPFSVLRRRTGLDLEGVLASPSSPRFLALEFMWQEWAGVFKKDDVFTPEWVKKALEEARRAVAGRSRIIAHLELTDFGASTVGPRELKRALVSALLAGAEGIEVYEASLAEKKNAWDSFSDLSRISYRKRILLLYDEGGESDARQLAAFCGHFSTELTVEKISSYRAGAARACDALFYLGSDAGKPLPEDFLKDATASGS